MSVELWITMDSEGTGWSLLTLDNAKEQTEKASHRLSSGMEWDEWYDKEWDEWFRQWSKNGGIYRLL